MGKEIDSMGTVGDGVTTVCSSVNISAVGMGREVSGGCCKNARCCGWFCDKDERRNGGMVSGVRCSMVWVMALGWG